MSAQSSQPSRDSVVTSGIAPDTKSDSQPCAHHYKKTRDRYGAILDNIGCICQVLLSLNLESCCVIPSHASIRSKDSAPSERSEAVKEPTRDLSTPTLYDSMETRKTEDCSKMSCCRGDSHKVVIKAVPEVASLKYGDYPGQSCCSNKISKPVTESTVTRVEEIGRAHV